MALLDSILSGRIRVNAQLQSDLFRLPAELRTMIYEYLFEHHMIHICPEEVEAIEDDYVPKEGLYHAWCLESWDPRKRYQHQMCSYRLTWRYLLGLALSCRRIYGETIQMLYSRHTFHFAEMKYLPLFKDLTPRTHLDVLTSLRMTSVTVPTGQQSFSEYAMMWLIISRLAGLKRLHVQLDLEFTVKGAWPTRSRGMLEPMKLVKQQLTQFDLVVRLDHSWFGERGDELIDECGLLWDACELDTSGLPEWAGLHPALRVVVVSERLENVDIMRPLPSEEEVKSWIYSFDDSPVFDPDAAEAELQREDLLSEAENDRAKFDSESEKEYCRLDDLLVGLASACQLEPQDFREMAEVSDKYTKGKSVDEYLFRYPEPPKAPPYRLRFLFKGLEKEWSSV